MVAIKKNCSAVTVKLCSFPSPDGCVFQLRLTVAEAVGSMCHLMASEKLEELMPKLIPAILSLYKKNSEHYIISKVGTDRLFMCSL